MEYTDLAVFLVIAGMLSFPLAVIYLILNALNWNERKNLFSDSWFVFLAWLLSGIITALMFVMLSVFFNIHGGLTLWLSFAAVLITANVIATAATLAHIIRAGEKTTLTNHAARTIETPRLSIWFKAILVSVLTWLMMFGFCVALGDIEQRFGPKKPDAEFGIYDI